MSVDNGTYRSQERRVQKLLYNENITGVNYKTSTGFLLEDILLLKYHMSRHSQLMMFTIDLPFSAHGSVV